MIQAENNFPEGQLERSGAFYRSFFETNPDAILLTSPQGKIYWLNPAACHLFGGTEKEMRELEWLCFVDTSDPKYKTALSQLTGAGSFREELTMLRRDGSNFRAMVSANTCNIEDQPAGMLLMIRDHSMSKPVTEDSQLETVQFRHFIDSNIVGIAIANAHGNVIQANDYYLNLLGVTRQDFIDGRVDWRTFTPPEWLPADEKAIAELRDRGVCEPYEKEYVRADGTRVPVYIADAMLPGPEEDIAAFVIDITGQKRAENELYQSERRYSLLFENSAIPTVLVKLPEMVIMQVNAALEKLVGYSLQEMRGMTTVELGITMPESHGQTIAEFEEQGSLIDKEIRILTKSGAERMVLLNANLIEFDAQNYVICTMQDITERKKAEAQLGRLSRLYITLSEVNWAVGHATDADALFAEVCRIAIEHGGYRMAWIGMKDESTQTVRPVAFAGEEHGYLEGARISYLDQARGRGPTGTAIREDRCVVLQDIASDPRMEPWREQALARGYRSSASIPIHRDGCTVGAFMVYASEPYDFDTKVENLLGQIGSGISSALDQIQLAQVRRQTEVALRRRQALLDQSQAMSHTGSWELDLVSNHLIWSDEVYRIFGLEPQEFDATYEAFLQAVHPDDRAAVDRAYAESVRQGRDTYQIEHRVVRRQSGEIRTVHEKCEHERDAAGRIVRSVGIVQDITERKKNETKQRENEERLRVALDGVNIAIFNQDLDLRYTWMYRPPLGYTTEQMIGHTDAELLWSTDWQKIEATKRNVLETGKGARQEVEIHTPDRTLIHELIVEPVFDAGGQTIGLIGALLDITQRKQAEGKLMAQFEELQRWYNINIEREERILELKREVNQLLRRQHESIRYPSAQEQI